MSEGQKALIRLKTQNPGLKITLPHILCLVFCVLSLLFTFSTSIFPAEEEQSDSDSEQTKKYRTISITTGPGGKVTWFFDKNIGMAHGDAIVEYDDIILKADHIWANMETELVEAQGNIKLKMGDQLITADHMLFDLRKKKGIMKDGVSFDDPWYHSGEEMHRYSEEGTLIEHGGMTSCSLDPPHYSFEASQIVIHLKKELIAKHVVLKMGGIPLLYFPIYRRSLEPEKRSRFIFKIGSNSFEGYYVKNILPIRWRMINGSTFFNYTTRRGKTIGTDLKYDADKIKLREIFLPVPEDASSQEWRDVRDKMDEILKRAEGELDKIWLKQIFIKFQIEEADKVKARERAEEVLEKSKAEDADFYRLARQWSDDKDTKSSGGSLGYFVVDEDGIQRKSGTELEPVEPELLPIIEEAFKLESDGVSDLIETEEGYHIVEVGDKDAAQVRVRHIFITFEASKKAQEDAQNKADSILTQLFGGIEFDGLAKLYSNDPETREKGGDMGWQTFQDLDISFRSVARSLTKGEVSSRTVRTSHGVYILKLEDIEETPDFGDLAKEYSEAPNAEMGGDTGYKGRWEFDPKIAREAFRLDIGRISKPIRTDDGYRIVQIEKKRRLGGDISLDYGDYYSYQREKNPVKLGQTWNVDIHHNQTLWRSDQQRMAQNRVTGQMGLRMEKTLAMRAQLRMVGKEFKKSLQGFSPERELRSYVAFDYYWMSKFGGSGRARVIMDATRDLLGEDTQAKQKYPEITYQSPNYQLGKLQPFKKVNSGLLYISDRVQGKTDFAKLARQVSDDPRTKEKSGDLGWLDSTDRVLNPRVRAKIFGTAVLDPGDVSEPIEVTDGYYIVKVEEVEEERGERKRAQVRQIFISMEPGTRTKDEARVLARQLHRQLTRGERPSLGFLTLNDTSFSFDIDAGNYFKDKYKDEEDIFLQTAYGSANLSKRAIIKLGIARELSLTVNGRFSQSWQSKTQPMRNSLDPGVELDPSMDPNERDHNIFDGAWSSDATLSTTLHRTYRTGFVPGIHAMRHTISPNVWFSYEPAGHTETRAEEQRPRIYPFGRASWSYERKQLSVGMTNSIDIKTERTRERISLFKWILRGGADFTRPEDSDRRYDYVRNTFTFTPGKRISVGTVLEHNPNNIGTDKPLITRFSTDIRYSDPKRRWTGYLSRRYIRDFWLNERQFFTGKVDLRWSKSWNLSCELEYEYDERVKDINRLRFSLHRVLHCWESRIGYSRYGTTGGYIRKDFFFQIDLRADPGKAIGVGYDDIAKSWTLRSLPGMGKVGGFLRSQSSLYY